MDRLKSLRARVKEYVTFVRICEVVIALWLLFTLAFGIWLGPLWMKLVFGILLAAIVVLATRIRDPLSWSPLAFLVLFVAGLLAPLLQHATPQGRLGIGIVAIAVITAMSSKQLRPDSINALNAARTGTEACVRLVADIVQGLMALFSPGLGIVFASYAVCEWLPTSFQILVFFAIGVMLPGAILCIAIPSEREKLFSLQAESRFRPQLAFPDVLTLTGQWSPKIAQILPAAIPVAYTFNLLMIAIAFFSVITHVGVTYGLLRFSAGTGNAPALFQIQSFFLWHFMHSVPLLEVNETLQWSKPLNYSSTRIGAVLLVFKISVIVPVIATFTGYLKYRQQLSGGLVPTGNQELGPNPGVKAVTSTIPDSLPDASRAGRT